MPRTLIQAFAIAALLASFLAPASNTLAQRQGGEEPRNIILIISDDHRYDFMSFMKQAPDFLETPNLDSMAEQGAHLANAFVSTSLCSPSRASILTGQYMHRHGVVDNQRVVPEGTVFFPQYLQQAGYRTALVGKWHMGEATDAPRPGFDHWVSFKGQGTYFDPLFNVNGEHEQAQGYTTDVITDYALDWLKQERSDPFYLQVAYKAVHYPFTPAPRFDERYAEAVVPYPETIADTESNYRTQPNWVRERRYGIHGIDHMFTGPFDQDPVPDFEDWYRQYAENVHGLDHNIGRILDYLKQSGLAENTLVIYTSDNGFAIGEHGFYDKRDAFEESIRVPMVAWAPGMIEPGTTITKMVQNIDLAPTFLQLTGTSAPDAHVIDGRSFLPLLRGERLNAPWRDKILYEYYWEWNFPATPTLFAIRTDRYKYIYYHGIWDINGLYDLKTDPHERHNLINVPIYQERAGKMRDQLFDMLEATGGMNIPLERPTGVQFYDRKISP